MRLLVIFFLIFNISWGSENCENTLFTFDVNQANDGVKIIDIVENIANQCNFSVVIKDKQSRKVLNENLYIVHIKDYSLDDIFEYLFDKHNMFYEYNTNKKVLKISYLDTRSFIIDYVNLSEQSTESTKTITIGASSGSSDSTTSSDSTSGGSGNSDTTIMTSKSSFQFWDTLAAEIDTVLSRDGDSKQIKSKSIINREAGVITITGTKNQITRVDSYLSKIKDRLHKQVVLETKLLELTYLDRKSTGVDWSKFDISLKGEIGQLWGNSLSETSNSFSYNFKMDGLLKFLKTYGDINMLSTPKIMTLNNQPAVINVGKQINYRYQSGSFNSAAGTGSTTNNYTMDSVFIGLTLNIVPEITDDGFIILRINPVVSETIDAYSNFDGESGAVVDDNGVRIMPPDIKIKQLSSIVKAKDGDRVVIGGLVSTTESNTEKVVPLLSSIPGLSWLFKNTTKGKYKTELIIVVTPHIVNNNEFPSIDRVEKILDGKLNE